MLVWLASFSQDPKKAAEELEKHKTAGFLTQLSNVFSVYKPDEVFGNLSLSTKKVWAGNETTQPSLFGVIKSKA
jgi:hypothetical protein